MIWFPSEFSFNNSVEKLPLWLSILTQRCFGQWWQCAALRLATVPHQSVIFLPKHAIAHPYSGLISWGQTRWSSAGFNYWIDDSLSWASRHRESGRSLGRQSGPTCGASLYDWIWPVHRSQLSDGKLCPAVCGEVMQICMLYVTLTYKMCRF